MITFKAFILYSSRSFQEGAIQVSSGENPLWVRTELVQCSGLSDALDQAKPRDGETVLNTVLAE